MGGNARIRKERAAAAKPPLPRVAIEILDEAVEVVGDRYGTENRCADAAALLITIGKHLGFTLEPRPVSLIAEQTFQTQPPTTATAFIGPKAAERLSEDEQKKTNKDYLAEGENLGHLVLTCDDPPLLLDGNLRQLNAMGFEEAPSLRAHINTAHPENGQWYLPVGDLNLLYLLDDDAGVLMENFDAAVAASSPEARDIARALRAGYTAKQIREAMER